MSKTLSQQTRREIRAILVGGLLILLVGGYFVSRFFWSERERDQEGDQAAVEKENREKNVAFIEPKILSQKIQNKDLLVLIDIRAREAYNAEHIPGSRWVSPSALASFSADGPKTIVVIASAADPAAQEVAQNALSGKNLSFFFLRGGFEGWKLEGQQTLSQGDPESFVDQSKVTYISPAELKRLLQAGPSSVVLLDVQSEENFRKTHLKGAVNIPLSQLEIRKEEIPVAKEIIVYGENELASFQGGVRLSDLHFFAVRTLTGNSHLSDSSPLFREP